VVVACGGLWWLVVSEQMDVQVRLGEVWCGRCVFSARGRNDGRKGKK
jgi:hypothetical protein